LVNYTLSKILTSYFYFHPYLSSILQ